MAIKFLNTVAVDTDVLYVDASSNNVGIGTTNPSQKLDVDGNIKLNQYGQSIYFGSTVNEIKGSASDFLYKSFSRAQWDNAGTYADSSYVFKQSGSEVFRIHTGGNVGIGTTSPSEKLEVDGNIKFSNGALFDSTTVIGASANDLTISTPDFLKLDPGYGDLQVTSGIAMDGGISTGGRGKRIVFGGGEDYLMSSNTDNDVLLSSWKHIRFGAGSGSGESNFSEKMRITSAGNVGIGTTSPGEKLDVAGDIASQGIYVDRTHESGGISNPFAKLGLHYFWGDSNSINLQKTGNNNKFTFSTQSGYLHVVNSSGAKVQIDSSEQSIKSALGTFNVGVAQHAAANNNQGNYISITNGGNTTGSRGVINVNGDLKINDYSTSSAIEKIKLKNDGSAYFAGNVGIGTTSPEAKLDIVGTPSSDYAPLTAVSLTGKTASGTGWSGTSVLTGYTHSAGNSDSLVTNIIPSANTKYLITFTISGITSGRYERIIFGGIVYNIYVSSNLTRTIAVRTENTNPLEVVVQTQANGAISIDSISAVGSRDSVITTRDSNASVKNQIRNGHTVGSMYIGFKSGESITSSLSSVNLGIGYQTLKDNISGTANTVVGFNNLSKSFATSYMTALGYNLFQHYSNPGNVYSIGIGTNIATSSNMTGGNNILLGNNMFMSATTANGNIAMGYSNMRNVTSGSKNVALGAYALFDNTIGSGNVAIGEYSLSNKVSGNYNLSIGNQAGRYLGGTATANLASDNSIFLGHKAGPNGDSQTNQIVIGHQAIGSGSNSVTLGATTITKTILNGSVGIGTTSPLNKLQVSDGSVGIDSQYMIRDNRNNTILQQSANTVASNRSLTIGNATYSNVIIPNGNVGIGTTSPSSKLHVAGATVIDGFTTGSAMALNVGGSNNAQIRTRHVEGKSYNSSSLGELNLNYYSSHNVSMAVGGGNVGIGTASPGEKLDVDGNILADGLGIGNNTIYSNSINLNNAGSLRIGNAEFISKSSNDMSIFQSKMVVTSAGNVGIGTTSPSTALHIKSTSAGGGYATIENTVHLAKLQLKSATYTGSLVMDGTGGYISGGGLILDSGTHPKTQFLQGGVSKMIINNGDVGIGTASPSEKLDVEGNIRVGVNNGFYINNQNVGIKRVANDLVVGGFGGIRFTSSSTTVPNQAERMRITSSGNVGIGTTSPVAKLDVNGNIRTNNQLTVYNSDLSRQSLIIKSEAATNTGLFKLSNGSNWGLLMQGYSNSPYIGAYFNGSLNITGFEDSDGTTPSAIKLAQFVFGGTGGGSGYLTLNGDLKVNTNKKIKFGYGNSQTNGIEWVSGSKISAAITPVDAANYSRTGLGFFTGDFSDGTTNAAERMRITRAGNVGIGNTSPSQKLEVDGEVLSDGYRVSAMQTAPAARNSTGTLGEIRITSNYIYICYATNSWSRVALATSW